MKLFIIIYYFRLFCLFFIIIIKIYCLHLYHLIMRRIIIMYNDIIIIVFDYIIKSVSLKIIKYKISFYYQKYEINE